MICTLFFEQLFDNVIAAMAGCGTMLLEERGEPDSAG